MSQKQPKKQDPTLEIGRWHSKCLNCGMDALPDEKWHETVVGYGGPKPPGCGIVWEFLTTGYIDLESAVQQMRPDLKFVSQVPEGLAQQLREQREAQEAKCICREYVQVYDCPVHPTLLSQGETI